MNRKPGNSMIVHAILIASIALVSSIAFSCGSLPNDTQFDCTNLDDCPVCPKPPKGPPGPDASGGGDGGGTPPPCPLANAARRSGGRGASYAPSIGGRGNDVVRQTRDTGFTVPERQISDGGSATNCSSRQSVAALTSFETLDETTSETTYSIPCHFNIDPESLFEGESWDRSFYTGNTVTAPMYVAAVSTAGGAEANAGKRIINLARTDFAMMGNGGSRIVLSRDYNNMTSNYQSNLNGSTALGPNWHLYYDMHVAVVADDVRSYVRTKGGAQIVLYPLGNGVWASNPATGESLRMERINGEYKLTSVGPEIYHVFDGNGRLKCMNYGNGNLVRIDRNSDGSIDCVRFDHETRNTDNRYLKFEYESVTYNQVIEEVRTPGPNPGDPDTTQTVDHSKTRRRLTQVKVYPAGTVVARYEYGHTQNADDSGMLTAVKNVDGVVVEGYDNTRMGDSPADPWTLVGLRQRGDDGMLKLARSYDIDESGHVSAIRDGNGNSIATFPGSDSHENTAVMPDGTTYEYTLDHARNSTHTLVKASNGTVLETIDQTFTEDEGWFQGSTSLLKTYSKDGGDTVTYSYVDSSISDYYSPKRRLVSGVSYANGASISYGYDDQNRITTVTMPLGRVSAYTYDAAGNITSFTNPEEGTYSYEYDDHGNVIRRTLPSTRTEEYGYGPYGEVTQTTDTEGRAAVCQRDSRGRLTTTTVEGDWVAYGYDSLDRVTTMTASDGSASSIQYQGNTEIVIGKTDNLGRSAHYDYDTTGNLTCVTDPSGRTIQYGYDSNDRLTTVTDQKSHASARVYDGEGRLIIKRNALGKETHYSYYSSAPGCAPCGAAKGQLATLVRPDATTEDYTYENDRLKSVQYSSGAQVQLTYDTAGRVTALQDTRIPYEYAQGNCTFHYEYDKNDRLTTTTYPDGAKIGYAYDSTSRRTSMTDPDGNVTQYGYGTGANSEALTSIQHPLSGQTIFNYFANGLLESEYREGNGGIETWEYDALKRPMRHTSYGSGGARINQESYTYNSAWMRTRVDRASDSGLVPPSTSKLYDYDSSDRFVSEREVNNATSATIYQQAFNYDDAGNRTAWNEGGTTMPFEFNAMNQMTNGGGLQCGYDENGNLLYRTDDINNPSFLHWFYRDGSGRLLAFEDLFVGTYLIFGYDTAGRMIWRTTSDGKVLKYYYDSNNVVLVKEAPSRENLNYYTKIVYTLAPGDIHQIIAESRMAYPSDWTGTGLTRWYHYDLAGSVVALSDDGAVPMVQYDQDAYGISSGAFGSNQRHLTGKEYDPDMGLYYFGARWYDPYTAQWIEPEPTGQDGPNLYWYGRADVLDIFDPDGLKCIDVIKDLVIGGAQGAAASADGACDFTFGLTPFQWAGAYDPNTPGLTFSKYVGGGSILLLSAAVGNLPGETKLLGPQRGGRLFGVQNPKWGNGSPVHVDFHPIPGTRGTPWPHINTPWNPQAHYPLLPMSGSPIPPSCVMYF